MLSKRLEAIAELLSPALRVADVGSDHGYLPIELAKRGFRGLIATDINPSPLDKARRNAAAAGVGELIELRLCDGLDGLREYETDAVVIAGLSAESIIGILGRAPWTQKKRLILQPMSHPEALRRWLSRNGYAIIEERLVVEDGRFFPVIRAAGGAMALTVAQEAAGLCPTPEYLRRLIRINEKALVGLEMSEKADDIPRREYTRELLRSLRRMERNEN